MNPEPTTLNDQNRLGQLLVALFQGVLYRDADSALWQPLMDLQARVRDYSATIGLELILDEAEGYAYLRQRPAVVGEPELPRLIQRRQLSYPVSLILALLRKKLAEFDATGGDTRLVIDRDQIAEQVRLFLPQTGNEARLLDRMDAHLNKVVELGFLHRLRGQDNQFEVRRILKAFVDAQWLADFEQRLSGYAAHAASGEEEA
ncbi:DUF4194 domain-containing protein [Massilia antarctica]|uniref:DUF4194 domain-containing protein n=1 Tax=Massilia antarctica TaxID=2765360 RepID=UPI0006BB5DF6|nr:DUF4194 domain-containing protein [Massilia sp. H27-R4]MCY0916400.1 DUF4194 domain-containing protein [Massilia sp. H27-R4]CUI07214.1 FIG039767: hypothetical protein [Janthinobacterium sp. CG23_2]CUU31000.1 FIG039767: hypothetical protein [Janthinobacterium sp. CG23_2]